ncbi:MAG TPA: alpha/beta hydrolase [Allosphingosinicella sp.]|jgi:alpha-beta hydrolase superfamily lysophospholipase|nr:alpha/beta hydrolase [Allosphingosinicella sp.]
MSRLLSILAALLAVLLAPAAHAAQEDWTGDWHGTLTTPIGALRLLLTIRQGPDGALAAEAESVDQAPGQKLPVATIAIAGGRLTFAMPAIRAAYEGSWDPARSLFAGTFTQNGTPLPLDLARGAGEARPIVAGLDGSWETRIERNGVQLRLILRVASGSLGTIAFLDSPDMMTNGLAVTGLARERQAVRFAVPVGESSFQGVLSADGARMSGRWSRAGQPDVEAVFTRRAAAADAAPRRPQEPHPPFPYRSEEVRIPNPRAPGVTLAGTLTLPQGEGPFAAAILISGSGAQDRDESLMGHKPFAVLADHLTRQGIAVLRYDDRGTASSTGNFQGATSADFATDAAAAFAYLRTRREIAGDAIGYIGHSEGGMIGPLAAADSPGAAFMVLLAGPGERTLGLMEAQRRAIGQSMGMSAAELDQAGLLQGRIMEIAAGDLSLAEAEAAMRAAMSDEAIAGSGVTPAQRDMLIRRMLDPWFRWFLRYDPAPALRALHMPVLALNGSLDRQVLPAANLAGIRAATAGNRDVTARELPGLNHLFQTARSGGIGEYAEIEETMAPVALETVAAWIKARFVRRWH